MLPSLFAACLFATLAGQEPANPATTPADRLNEDWWKQRHEQCIEITKKGGVDIVFLGDSITQGWESTGKAAWDKWYGDKHAANFGFSGDRTEHVLWRLGHGEIVGLKPKVVVMMIGTNNVGHGSSNPKQAAQGISLILKTLMKELPSTKILLLAVFPRAESPQDPMRHSVDEINAQITSFDDGHRVHFEDIGYAFKNTDGTLRTLLMPDQLHLNEGGYEIWGEAMDRALSRMLGHS
ncbi:MAG: hypothetical protein JSS66_02705 [Armatimonadetes bacterium]|nr:hypothetical protein [Armatimonadota bacterium]